MHEVCRRHNEGVTGEQPRNLLSTCTRVVFIDTFFHNAEVIWYLAGKEVATGFFRDDHAEVIVTGLKDRWVLTGEDAEAVRFAGTLQHVERCECL